MSGGDALVVASKAKSCIRSAAKFDDQYSRDGAMGTEYHAISSC